MARFNSFGRWLGLIFALTAVLATPPRALAGETVTYYYTNEQGTPLTTTDGAGALTAASDYRPYGIQALGSAINGPGYTGHVNDVDSGFVYMQARYYDPEIARFVSTDPNVPRDGDTFNFSRYVYGNNNPILDTDPDGRETGVALRNMNLGVGYPQLPAQTFAEKAIAGGALALVAAPIFAITSAASATATVAAVGAESSSSAAVGAAIDASVAAQSAGATSGATTGLITEAGEVFTGASTNAGGAGAATNATVQEALNGVSTGARSAFHGCCGEIDALSNAANAGAKLEGATMATVRAAGRQAGQVMKACSSCQAVADKLGINVVSPP
jgi:RHS repeat-associated protein